MVKKTGIELIADERQEQIVKHGYTGGHDVIVNDGEQLCKAAAWLAIGFTTMQSPIPQGWDIEIWRKMCNKPYKERLIVAGALIAAEIDRLTNSGE